MSDFKIGDKVRIKVTAFQDAAQSLRDRYLLKDGEILKASSWDDEPRPTWVWVNPDCPLGIVVYEDEIELIENA